MRSTRYLNNNMSVDDVKMIGFAAVITKTEAQSKVGFSDLNSVITTKQKRHGIRPETMIDSTNMMDSNSQTDMYQIGIADHSTQMN